MPTEKKINNNNTNPPTKRSKTQQVRSESLEGGQDSAGNSTTAEKREEKINISRLGELSSCKGKREAGSHHRGLERAAKEPGCASSAALRPEETACILFSFFLHPPWPRRPRIKCQASKKWLGRERERRGGDLVTPLPPPGRGGKRARGRRASARTGKHRGVKQVRLQVQRPAGDGDVQEVKPPGNPGSPKPWHGSGKSRGLSGDDFNPEGNSRGQEPALLNAQTPQELELCTRRGRVSKPDRGLQKKKRREESTPESLTRRPGKASSGEGRRESGSLVPESERKQLRSSSAGWEGGKAVKKSWHEDEEGRTGRGGGKKEAS